MAGNNFHDSDGSPQSTNERLEELHDMILGLGGGTANYRLIEDPPGSGDYKTEVERI